MPDLLSEYDVVSPEQAMAALKAVIVWCEGAVSALEALHPTETTNDARRTVRAPQRPHSGS